MGPATILLASQKAVDQYGFKTNCQNPCAVLWQNRIRFPEFPVLAVKKLLASLDKTLEDFDLVENNEAFALNNLLF
jgi:acetyl-CoA C-acetyltransferase